jgi:hypothetical protein
MKNFQQDEAKILMQKNADLDNNRAVSGTRNKFGHSMACASNDVLS